MAIKEGKTVVAITLSKFYKDKLDVMCLRAGISKSEMVRKFIDSYKLFGEMVKNPPE